MGTRPILLVVVALEQAPEHWRVESSEHFPAGVVDEQ